MYESPTPPFGMTDSECMPPHTEIAQCARDLWVQYGRPADRDLAIWLEAENRLLYATLKPQNEDYRTASSSGPLQAERVRASNPPFRSAGSSAAYAAAFPLRA
jgi:hypothetical protein